MYCKSCGQEISSGARFCSKCGCPVGEFQNTKPRNAGQTNSKRKPQKSGLPWLTLFLTTPVVISLYILGTKTCERRTLQDNELIPVNQTFTDVTEHRIDYPDVEGYFEENSRVISVVDVDDSENTMSEADVLQILESRGFMDYPITTEYSMDGIYSDAYDITAASDDKHPTYETYYINSSNELWSLLIIDGTIIAIPVSYNSQPEVQCSVIVSESGDIVSYDSSTNRFYRTVPYDSVLDLRQVDRVDATMLDSLTVEVLSNG